MLSSFGKDLSSLATVPAPVKYPEHLRVLSEELHMCKQYGCILSSGLNWSLLDEILQLKKLQSLYESSTVLDVILLTMIDFY